MLTFKDYLIEQAGNLILWHGSGSNFDRFLRMKAHTGEGGAAFGSGIYLSQNRAVGEFYQKLLKSPTATLYKTKVRINTDKIVRWDKPLSKQPEPVRKVLSDIAPNPNQDPMARHVYHSFRASFGSGRSGPRESELATKHLEDNGLEGIFFVGDTKYKGPERDITKNYVIFNPNQISILDKFNLRQKSIMS